MRTLVDAKSGVVAHRSGLKAEMGAFYPLLLLRPLEAERPEPGQLMAALSALEKLCGQAQFLVGLRPSAAQYDPLQISAVRSFVQPVTCCVWKAVQHAEDVAHIVVQV